MHIPEFQNTLNVATYLSRNRPHGHDTFHISPALAELEFPFLGPSIQNQYACVTKLLYCNVRGRY